MGTLLEQCGRRFQVMAYHDAVRHDGPALELAELVDGELGPALVTALFASDSVGDTTVLLADSELPLPILMAFMAAMAKENGRIREAGSLRSRRSGGMGS